MKKNHSTLLPHQESCLETLVSHTLLPADGGISEFDFLICSQNTITNPFVAKHFIQGIENQYRTHKKETSKFRVFFLLPEYQPGLSLNTKKHNSITGTMLKLTKGGKFS